MHGHVGRERAEYAHRGDGLTLGGVHTVGVVADRAAGEEARPVVAQVLEPLGARRADATGRDERQHDVIALLEARDAFAHLGDDPGTLVAADDGVGLELQIAGEQVFVRVAETGRGQLDLNLADPGVAQIHIDDFPAVLLGLPDDGCLGAHARTPNRRGGTILIT